MNKQKSIGIILFLLCISCVYNHTANTEKLGEGYFYLGDGRESQILLGNEEKNSGITIVPQEVKEYSFDDRFIIAKSSDLNDEEQINKYWIVDKENKDDSIVALDSITFVNTLKKLRINLVLKDRK